jgi:hypothetical protein
MLNHVLKNFLNVVYPKGILFIHHVDLYDYDDDVEDEIYVLFDDHHDYDQKSASMPVCNISISKCVLFFAFKRVLFFLICFV